MAIFCGLLFLTLPTHGEGGNFIAFFAVFMVLFLTAGLGSASTFQMISVIFRKMTMDRVKAQGGSEAQAMREAATDTAAALGFYFGNWRDWRFLFQGIWYFRWISLGHRPAP